MVDRRDVDLVLHVRLNADALAIVLAKHTRNRCGVVFALVAPHALLLVGIVRSLWCDCRALKTVGFALGIHTQHALRFVMHAIPHTKTH